MAAVFLVTLAAQLLALPLVGIPVPYVHDEFGYLLAGATFALGRLTNPAHPMWVHFETFHVLMQPTYMAMHPPAQGAVLALGILLAHLPVAGVWLSCALFCAAVCWALQAWVPPGWALLGGFLATLRIGVLSYWATSYWGGAVAGIGGALVLGAVGRLRRGPRPLAGGVLGVGLSLLALSRPFEGFVSALPVAGWLLWRLARPGTWSRGAWIRSALVPASLVVALAGAFLLRYDLAITGHALKLPYQLDRETYAVGQHFVWQAPRPAPAYRHEVMRRFYTSWELSGYQGSRRLSDLATRAAGKFGVLWLFFVGPLLTPALLAGLVGLRSRRLRIPAAILGLSAVGWVIVAWWMFPHYAAPVAAVLVLVLVEGLRRLAAWRPAGARRAGRPLVAAFAAAGFATLAVRLAAAPLGLQLGGWPPAWYTLVRYAGFARADIEARLESLGGRHLVLVRYAKSHSPHLEYVYNGPDIDAAPVVWAREMGGKADSDLLSYFRGRTAWLLEADARPPKLVPYSPEAAPRD